MSDIDELFDEETQLGEPDPALVDAAPPDEPEQQEEQQTSTKRPAAKKGGSGRKSKADTLAELKGMLADEAYKVGGMVSPVLPTLGGYMIAESEESVSGLVELAKDNPRALDALKQVAKLAPGVAVGRFMVGAATCVLVDMRKVDPDTVPARMLGVTRVWVATHKSEAASKGVYVADPAPIAEFEEL